MKISVLIPTKNEPLIDELTNEIHKTLRDFDHEIIVIDKSNIPPKITNAKLIVQLSDGLGKAVVEGLAHATGDIIVTMDGDFSHDPKDLPRLIEKTKEYDIVIGSRFVNGGVTEDETHRKFISKIFRILASFILKLEIEDSMSGFAAIKRKVYDNLKLNPVGYKINMEILYKGKKLGFKATEVPILFHKRKAGKSKAKFKEALRTLIFIFKLKMGYNEIL
jgi:dolichol-phosphate mannosyltransferase